MKMSFDGVIGDMGSKAENVTTYEMAYSGVNVEGMKEHLRKIVREKGVEIVSPFTVSNVDGGKFRVGVTVRSLRGIV
jgi:hypothetical protein